jgi:hypothetical protein
MISEVLAHRDTAGMRPSAAQRIVQLARNAGSDAEAIDAVRKALDELLS